MVDRKGPVFIDARHKALVAKILTGSEFDKFKKKKA